MPHHFRQFQVERLDLLIDLCIAVFHGKLYTAANGAGAQVWRSDEGDNWSAMMTNSFGDATNRGINQLIVFHDQLYAGTWNCVNNNCTTSKGGQVWRTDGTTWSKVVDKGFGQAANYTVGAFAEFSGQLYAVTDSFNGTPQVYRSSSGDAGTWSRVMANGFGGNGAWTDISMGVYGGSLYVGFGRGYPGVLGELWRCTICDGTDWSPVFTDGRGNSNNQAVRAITEYDGRLYIALSNRTDGAEVWSCATCDGTDWSPLLTGGKGDLNNNFADGLYVYGGNLYVILGSLQNGVEVWHCHLCNGDWTQDASGGWGDANNLLASYFNKGAAAFGGRLFIGTANWGNGGEIWATDAPSYPVVASIIRADASPTTASSVNFTVSFSDDVTGVTAGDFTLAATTKLTGASITDVSGSGRTWTVTVGNYTGNGTLRLDLADDDTIMDAGLDPLGGSGMGNGDFSSGESYMIPASKTYTSIAGQDGWVLESGEITSKGGSMNTGAATFNLGDDALNRQYRSILSFDTSGSPLPGGAVITSVTLKITKAGMVGGNPFKTLGKLLVDIQHGTFGTALLQVTDFQSAASKGSVLTFTNGVYSNSLSSSYFNYVNPAGMMQFRLRFTKDDNNNLLADYLKFYSGNYTTVPANQPTLIITYYVP